MKKERNPLVVILSIFFLSLFVILPPTFRNLIPREESNIPSNGTNRSLVIVSCNKIYEDELYKVVSKSKYVNGKLNSNTITYTKLEQTADSNNKTEADQTQNTVDEQQSADTTNQTEKTTDNTVENNTTIQDNTVKQEAPIENKTSTTSEILAEIDYFKTIPNLQLTEEGNVTTIVIDNDIITSNPHEELLNKNFNSSYSKQMKFYTDKGFTCSKNEG